MKDGRLPTVGEHGLRGEVAARLDEASSAHEVRRVPAALQGPQRSGAVRYRVRVPAVAQDVAEVLHVGEVQQYLLGASVSRPTRLGPGGVAQDSRTDSPVVGEEPDRVLLPDVAEFVRVERKMPRPGRIEGKDVVGKTSTVA